jgi:hypothetical protein
VSSLADSRPRPSAVGLDNRLRTSGSWTKVLINGQAFAEPSCDADGHRVPNELPAMVPLPTHTGSGGPPRLETLKAFAVFDARYDETTSTLCARHPNGWRRVDADRRATLESRYSVLRPTEPAAAFRPVEAVCVTTQGRIIRRPGVLAQDDALGSVAPGSEDDHAQTSLWDPGKSRVHDAICPPIPKRLQTFDDHSDAGTAVKR